MADRGAVGAPAVAFAVVEIDRMGSDHIRTGQSRTAQAGERSTVAALVDCGYLRLALRHMQIDPRPDPARTCGAFGQQRIGTGVQRVWRDAGDNARARGIDTVAFDQPLGRPPVGRATDVDDGGADGGAQPARLDDRRIEVHVGDAIGDGGDAIEQEFRAGRCQRAAVILRGEPVLSGHTIAALRPERPRPVVRKTAEQRQRSVGVGVDEPRQHQATGTVDDRIARRHQRSAGSDRGDGRSLDPDVAIGQDTVIRIHRRNRPMGEHKGHNQPPDAPDHCKRGAVNGPQKACSFFVRHRRFFDLPGTGLSCPNTAPCREFSSSA